MDAVPPKISASKVSPANARIAAIILAVTAAGIGLLVYFFNPSAYGFYPVCQFHRLTGLNCPGCGGTRALYALLHGEVQTAVRDNALFVIGAVAGVMRGVWYGINWLRGRANDDFLPSRFLLPLIIVTAAFGVLRNLPGFSSFLSP